MPERKKGNKKCQYARIGLDIGGSSIRGGLFTEDLTLLSELKDETPQTGTKDVLQTIYSLIDSLQNKHPKYTVRSIGVGLPGPISESGKTFRYAVNISGFENVPLIRFLHQRYPHISSDQIKIANDANCAALGESYRRSIPTLFYLGLGTGLGSGFVLDGTLYTGRAIAPELGHTVLNFNGPLCSCGSKGCLEQYVGTAGLKRIAKRSVGKTLDAYELTKRARAGETNAIRAFNEYGRFVGMALSNVVNTVDPPVIVLGGGIMQEATLFMKEARLELKRRMFSQTMPTLVYSKNTKNGLLGAALLCA